MHFLTITLALCLCGVPQDAPGLASQYGFDGHEIYKVDHGIVNLVFADMDGDGRTDMGFINNARSRIELYLRLPDDAPDIYELEDPDAINEVTYDGRYKKEYIPVEQEVVGLTVGRFDGDEVLDAAFITNTAELNVELRGAERKKVRIRSFKPVRGGLEAADMDGDGRDDLVVLGEEKTLVYLQTGDEWLETPELLYNLHEKPGGLALSDLDGDGNKDLLYVYYQGEYPFHIRFQKGPGIFGPVVARKAQGIRAYDVKDLDGSGGEDVLAVYRNSGRLAYYTLEPSGDPELMNYPLRGVAEGEDSTYTLADLDGDHRSEILMADAKAARISVVKGLGSGEAVHTEAFPSLRGVSHPRVADLDGDGAFELTVISSQEKVIGVCAASDTLEFPRFVAVEGEPVAMDTGDVNGDGTADVVCIAKRGLGSKKEYILNLLYTGKPGEDAEAQVIQKAKPKVKALAKDPLGLRLADVNRDGLDDLIVFMKDEVPAIYFNRDGTFEFGMGGDTPGLGILDKSREWTVCPVDTGGDGQRELAVCSGNLVRFIYIPEGASVPQAVKQFNSPEAADAFTGCAFGDVMGDERPELVAYESMSRTLYIVAHDDTVAMKIDVGRFDFRGLETADLNGDGKKDIVVKGQNRVGVWLSGGESPALKEMDTYESKDKDTYFLDVGGGDVNSSGAADAVLVDSGQESLFIVAFAEGAFKHALKFKVFEEKLFHSRKGGAEPHGVRVADANGDGKDDVVVLVHDKIIIYPQE